MAVGTIAIGLTPPYATIGVFAPALLIVARLFQGFSVGGEWGNSTAYIVELAPDGKRSYYSSFQQCSLVAGLLLGSGIAALLNTLIASTAMESWGWRIPFLIGGLIGAGRNLHAAEAGRVSRLSALEARPRPRRARPALGHPPYGPGLRLHDPMGGPVLHLPRLHADLHSKLCRLEPCRRPVVEHGGPTAVDGDDFIVRASVGSNWAKAPAPRQLRRLRPSALSHVQSATRRLVRPDDSADPTPVRACHRDVLRRRAGSDLGDLRDPRAHDPDVDCQWHGGGDLRGIRALYRDLADRQDGIADFPDLLRDRRGHRYGGGDFEAARERVGEALLTGATRRDA